MTEKIQYIPARLKNAARGGHVAGVEDIVDDLSGKTQQEINSSVDAHLEHQDNKIDALEKQDVVPVAALPSIADADPKKIYRVTGTDSYTDYMLNAAGTDFDKLATYAFPGIDDEPTAGSDNPVKSGGIQKELALGAVYDVSAKNPTAGPNNNGKWESLLSLLSDANLNTLIPTAVRKGGMSIKFVRSSDNKYVQFRYMSSSTAAADFTNVANWQGVTNEVKEGSKDLVESGAVDKRVAKIHNFEIGATDTEDKVEILDKNDNKVAEILPDGIHTKGLFNLENKDYFETVDKLTEHIETDEGQDKEDAIIIKNGDNVPVFIIDDKYVRLNPNKYIDDSEVYNVPYILNYGLDQMMVQWTTPFAIITKNNFRSKLIWGWTDSNAKFGVGLYDERTKFIERKEIGSVYEKDMHNSPAVFELEDGKIAVVSCRGHNSYRILSIYISTEAGSISNFDNPIEVKGWAGLLSYSQIHYINGVYYIFVRTYDWQPEQAGTNEWKWQFITSQDFINWSSPQTVLDGGLIQYYCRFVKVTDNSTILRMAMYSNPARGATEIRLGYFDTSTGNLYSGTVSQENIVGNVNDTVPQYTAYSVIIPMPSNYNQRLFDVAVTDIDNVEVLYSRWTDEYNSTYYLYKNGTIINLCNGGEAYLHARAQLGARFVDKDNIAISRNTSGFDYIELFRIINNIPYRLSQIDKVETGSNHFRVHMPMLDEDGKYLFYAKGIFDIDDYKVFDSDIVFVKL